MNEFEEEKKPRKGRDIFLIVKLFRVFCFEILFDLYRDLLMYSTVKKRNIFILLFPMVSHHELLNE